MAKKKYSFDDDGRIVISPKQGTVLYDLMEKNLEIIGEGIIEKEILEAMGEDYPEYVGNRLVGRDLPLAIDGLNFSMRRILFAANQLGLKPGGKKLKVASIASETNKYHPHNEMTIASTLARMGRHSDMIFPLFIAEGNFGNALNKKQGAPRYTSATLSKFAYYTFLKDSKVTDEIYDTRLSPTFNGLEPVFLPTRYPYMLLEWNMGICVGVATQLPAFNFTDLMNATIKLIDEPDAKVKVELDTPTDIFITNKKELKNCFDEHAFHVKMESKWHTEIVNDRDSKGKLYEKYLLVITSCPVNVKPIKIYETIVDIKRKEEDSKIPVKTFDEIISINKTANTDKLSFKIFIEYAKGTDPNELMEKIHKVTGTRQTVGVICTVIVDGNPAKLTPRDLVNLWIEERITLVSDWIRQNYIKNKFEAMKREAFIIIKPQVKAYVSFLDSSNLMGDELVEAVSKKFGLSKPQARYILDIQFKRITNANVKVLKKEMEDFQEQAKYYKSQANVKSIKKIIKEQLKEGIDLFGRSKRCEIIDRSTKRSKTAEVVSNMRYLLYNKDGYYCLDDPKDISMISERLERSHKFLAIDDAESYMCFTSDGGVKNVRGVDFTSTINLISHKGVKDVVSIISSKCKELTLITATGICKSLETSSVAKGKGGKVIKLKAKDHLVDAIATTSKGALGLIVEDKLHYTDMSNIPMQKKGAAGNNVFKGISKPSVERAIFIPNKADKIIILSESGYVKVLENALAGRDKTKNYIANQGKNIINVVFHNKADKETKHQYIHQDGPVKLVTMMNGKKMDFVSEVGTKSVKIGTTISTPTKLFKVKKLDYYDLV